MLDENYLPEITPFNSYFCANCLELINTDICLCCGYDNLEEEHE